VQLEDGKHVLAFIFQGQEENSRLGWGKKNKKKIIKLSP
jgi:hypothetical protein